LEYKRIVTPPFVLDWPSVFSPEAFKGKVSSNFSITAIFEEGTDLSTLKDLVKAKVKEKYPNGVPQSITYPFKRGDDKQDGKGNSVPGYTGAIYIKCKTQFKPIVIDASKQVILDEKQIYRGCICRAEIHAYCTEYMGKHYVSIGLDILQKMYDREPFKGGVGGAGGDLSAFSVVEDGNLPGGKDDPANYSHTADPSWEDVLNQGVPTEQNQPIGLDF